ncbi:MAG: hypothetical protein ACP5OG_02640 [Candidatus Nanoarchaeia archaeon]
MVKGNNNNEKIEIKRYENGESPVNIALKKEELDYLGNWNLALDKDGEGFVYRFAVKDNVIDNNGNNSTLNFYFYHLITKKGKEMPIEKQKERLSLLESVAKVASIVEAEMNCKNIISNITPAPKWMHKDLEDYLNNKEK